MWGLDPTVREIVGKFCKRKNCKIHVKKFATLLNIYYVTKIFKEFREVLSSLYCCLQTLRLHRKWSFPLRVSSVNVTKSAESCGFFVQCGLINTALLEVNLYIQEVCSLSYLLFDFSPIKTREKKNSLEGKDEIIFFMFCNNFFHKNTVGESEAPSLL